MHILVFTGGLAPLPKDTAMYFANTPKIDYIITADSGLDTLESFQQFYNSKSFTPNLIMGDMDSISDRSLLKKYSSVRSEIFNHDKDFTDTELALQAARRMCRDRERDMITLVGGNGGRADHFVGIYQTFSADYHADVWLCGKQSVCFVKSGCTLLVSNVNTDDRISVSRPLGVPLTGTLTTCGLEWESSLMRNDGMPSISNRISRECFAKREKISFSAAGGSFLVYVPITAVVEHTCSTDQASVHSKS